MDTLTHALAGALLGRATASRRQTEHTVPTGRRMLVGFFAAAFPDIDVLASYLSPLAYLYHHRGITHSVVLLPLWAALLALIFAALWRGKPRWQAYFGIAALGLASHITTDWITSFGTMMLAPLSDARYGIGTTFIIDLWFTAIIVSGLIGCWILRASRVPAVLGLAALTGYVVFQWTLQREAVEFGEAYARTRALRNAYVTALPRPVSPFNWTVMIEHDSGYEYAHINLVRKSPRPRPTADANLVVRLDAPYRPREDARWLRAPRYGSAAGEIALAREAYRQPSFRFFRWFAAYPALLRVDIGNPLRCVWFHDLRFVTPGRAGTPFQYGMCSEDGGPWQPFQLLGERRLPVY